jgi:predicted aspartyl protease
MITGLVNPDYEAVIRLRIQGPGGHEREIDAVIDTGFNGYLTLELPREGTWSSSLQRRPILHN